MLTGIKYFTEVFLNVLQFNWSRRELKKSKSPKMSLGALWFLPGPLCVAMVTRTSVESAVRKRKQYKCVPIMPNNNRRTWGGKAPAHAVLQILAKKNTIHGKLRFGRTF